MSRLNPYKFWTREELFDHSIKQSNYYGYIYNDKIKDACFDLRWDPIEEYDGCTLIQDKFHPYVPCLLHDYTWKVRGEGKKYDIEFRKNLILFGTNKIRAWLMFFGVRIGWLFYKKS